MFCKLKTIVVFLRIISDIIGLRNFGRIYIYIYIYILNSRGPRTDPCGTPDVTSSQELYVEFILTRCFRDVR